MKENVLPIKKNAQLRHKKSSETELHLPCPSMPAAKSYPLHFHLHLNLASSFPLTLRCGNNKGEIRHCSCFLNHTSLFWIYCQDLIFGRNSKKGQTGGQLQVCRYSFVWGWRQTWQGLSCAWQSRGSFISPWGMLEGEQLSCCSIRHIFPADFWAGQFWITADPHIWPFLLWFSLHLVLEKPTRTS